MLLEYGRRFGGGGSGGPSLVLSAVKDLIDELRDNKSSPLQLPWKTGAFSLKSYHQKRLHGCLRTNVWFVTLHGSRGAAPLLFSGVCLSPSEHPPHRDPKKTQFHIKPPVSPQPWGGHWKASAWLRPPPPPVRLTGHPRDRCALRAGRSHLGEKNVPSWCHATDFQDNSWSYLFCMLIYALLLQGGGGKQFHSGSL